jgi:multiple sugar transport system substrate-binding protein
MRGSGTRMLGALLIAAAVGVGACGGDDDSGRPAADAERGSTEGATKAPTLERAEQAKGHVTFCVGKDTSGGYTDAVERFNARYKPQGLSAELLEFPEGSDAQRQQTVQRLEARSPECDVYQADVIWIAELAQQHWAMDLSDYIATRAGEFIPSTLAPNRYDDRYWAVPQVTGAGLLYRRTDQVEEPPPTWQEVYRSAASHDGMAYQGGAYEGLTCSFLEIAYAAGGKVLSEDGKSSAFDSPENLEALRFMADGIKQGAAPRGVTTYMEEPARRAFESGRVTYMRNWSYAYALNQKAPTVRGKFEVTPLPAWDGGGRAGILGGNGPFLSVYSKNPEGGLLFIDHLTSADTLKRNMAKYSLPSVLEATYDEPEIQKAVPYAAELKKAIEQAQPRPVSPVYPRISQAIYENVNKALSGETSPEEAIKLADQQIDDALATF